MKLSHIGTISDKKKDVAVRSKDEQEKKQYANKRCRAKDSMICFGDTVLICQKKQSKFFHRVSDPNLVRKDNDHSCLKWKVCHSEGIIV